MRPSVLASVVFLLVASQSFSQVASQTSPQPASTAVRDPQAISILESALKAMGGAMPADTVATGTIKIVAGLRTETGTIRIATRGIDQTSEQIDTEYSHLTTVYSRGAASKRDAGVTTPLPGEIAVTAENHDSPLNLIVAALSTSTINCSFIGTESINGLSVQHIRTWISSPKAQLAHLAQFSAKDLWFDASSFLPIKLAFQRHWERDSGSFIAFEVFYSNYRNAQGILYASEIQKTFNGTPWTTINITGVAVNAGLSDSDFQVAFGTNNPQLQGAHQ